MALAMAIALAMAMAVALALALALAVAMAMALALVKISRRLTVPSRNNSSQPKQFGRGHRLASDGLGLHSPRHAAKAPGLLL